MEHNIKFSAITVDDLLGNDVFIQWLLFPDALLNAYWVGIQQKNPQAAQLIEQIRLEASELILSDHTEARVLLPCG
ncbi:hypothetical protein SAMN05216436_12825 [bacterium A37T11]|nr:hypothetical protein SAMN05216436_12825 [bacterium A37T11]